MAFLLGLSLEVYYSEYNELNSKQTHIYFCLLLIVDMMWRAMESVLP